MPSYLSSVQTGVPRRCEHLVLVRHRIGEHRFQRPEQRQLGPAELVVARQLGGVTEVAGEHARPLDFGKRPIESGGDARLQVAFTQTDSQIAGQDLGDVLGSHGIGAVEQRPQRRLLGLAAGRGDLGERGIDLGERRRRAFRLVLAVAEKVVRPPGPGRTTGCTPLRAIPAPPPAMSSATAAIADQPIPVVRGSRSGNGRPVRYVTASGSSAGAERAQVLGEGRNLLGRA